MARKKSSLMELLKKTKINENEQQYSEEEILKAISLMEEKEILSLQEIYGPTYNSVCKSKMSISPNTITKIRKIMAKNRRLALDKKGIELMPVEESIIMKPIQYNEELPLIEMLKKIINTNGLFEVKKELSYEEILILILYLGLSQFGQYSKSSIATIFNIKEELVDELIKSAMIKYEITINKSVTKEIVKIKDKQNGKK